MNRTKRIIELLSKLPGVGEKTAQRYLLFLLTADESVARELGAELSVLRDWVKPCERCGNIAEVEDFEAERRSRRIGELEGRSPSNKREETPSPRVLCNVCTDNKRDGSLLCVVARVTDLLAIERAGSMRGRYFVLGKLLSPLEGIGPEELPLERLVARIREDGVREVIVATPPSVDGEATALLLKRELGPLGVAISRIASGVPHGGDLEFADPITMSRALAGRQRL